MFGVKRSASDARSTNRPAKRLVAVIFIVAICFCAICGKVLLDARHAAWERAGEMATGLVSTITLEIARNIESYDLSLQAVIESLAYPEIVDVSPALRQRLLFDRSATAKHLHAIAFVDENGIVRLDSRTPFPEPVSRADRDFFQFHKTQKTSGIHVSRPFIAPTIGAHIVALSRRVSNPDGSFAGVVVGTIRLAYFEELFKGAAIRPDQNVSLFRTDGMLVMRWPYRQAMIGSDMKHAEIFKHLPLARSGRFESYAAADGVYRLFSYRQMGDIPLVVSVGQSTTDIYKPWRRYATAIGVMMIVLCGISVTFAMYLVREMRRRTEAETILETLAATDGLTGLSNRRTFNAAIEREWRRASRDDSELALLMIDNDHFKRYNDLYGHQAGDCLLQTLGAAMLVSIRRGTDVAARYGGDEFAIVLPGTSELGALQVAKYLRERFADGCKQREIPHSGLSIGIAAFVPKSHQTLAALIAAADEALYRAKEMGRNRTEVSEPEQMLRPAVAA